MARPSPSACRELHRARTYAEEAPRQARAERAHPIGVRSDEPLILVVMMMRLRVSSLNSISSGQVLQW